MRDGIIDAVPRVPRRSRRCARCSSPARATRSARAWTSARRPSRRPGKPGFDPRTTSEALRAGVQTFIRELWELDKPTIAAVNGAAVGPGAHLALACDFVLVHPRTRFIWSFAKWGLVVDAGGAYLLPRLVGLPRAKAMVMLGEGATGAEAVDLGLAYRCVDDPEALLPRGARARAHARRRARPARSGSRSGCSTRRSRPTSRLARARRRTSRRSPPRRPISSRAWPRSARSATRSSTGLSDRRDRAAADATRRGVQRVRRRPTSRLLLCRLSDITERPGWWTLPGGGIDFGEHPEAGALRELHEETGLIGRIVELLAVDSLRRERAHRAATARPTTTASASSTAPRSSAASCGTRPTRAPIGPRGARATSSPTLPLVRAGRASACGSRSVSRS